MKTMKNYMQLFFSSNHAYYVYDISDIKVLTRMYGRVLLGRRLLFEKGNKVIKTV